MKAAGSRCQAFNCVGMNFMLSRFSGANYWPLADVARLPHGSSWSCAQSKPSSAGLARLPSSVWTRIKAFVTRTKSSRSTGSPTVF